MKKIFFVLVIAVMFGNISLAMAGENAPEGGYAGAVAELEPTGNVLVSGKIIFTELPEGLKVNAEVEGAPAGKHGFHIHEKGDCANQGNAAGGHFNPDAVPHGDLGRDGFQQAHAGDLGNIEVGEDGKGKVEKVIPGLSLKGGKYSVGGRSVILHEKEDDYGQPTGNAGGRIGCAVIPKIEK